MQREILIEIEQRHLYLKKLSSDWLSEAKLKARSEASRKNIFELF